ncbi:MAG TPA: GNAT family N-acetyltransferase [Solirubrobacteraceae bacterium]|nr:GNAT family N-acetyltransferase [Solirubrobacteraceae bacterium]
MRRELGGGFELDDDPGRIDLDAVHAYISGESYWGRGRSRELVERAIAGSRRVVGLYLAPPRASGPRARPGGAPGTAGSAEQVGFARAVSDGATVAYLADVYVLSAYRGRGLGLELVREILEGDSGWEIRWLLHTADAQGLYERVGFAEGRPAYPLMERARLRAPGDKPEPPAGRPSAHRRGPGWWTGRDSLRRP